MQVVDGMRDGEGRKGKSEEVMRRGRGSLFEGKDAKKGRRKGRGEQLRERKKVMRWKEGGGDNKIRE